MLVFPVNTNGPEQSQRAKELEAADGLYHNDHYCHLIKPSPGVFVADEAVALAVVPRSAEGFSGVLEAKQDDLRAGVFTIDLLCSLS